MLTEKKLAILGNGMMGGALARGLVRAGAMPASGLVFYDIHTPRAQRLADEIGPEVTVATSLQAAISQADLILPALKPNVLPEVLAEIASAISPKQLVISIAAGVTLTKMEALLPGGIPVIRTMPNTPCLVGCGATALCRGTHVTDAHLELARHLFASVGVTVVVEEKLIDAVTGLSGSGPAYVYLMIEALADGGVKAGLTREIARLLAAQTVYGAAQMVLSSEEHPAQLKDNVTTPGGTTIAALAVLERAGFRTALIDAIEAATARSKELS